MIDRDKVIKELHDARRYLEDKEWSDRGASPHIDAINDALALLKEQEPTTFKPHYIDKYGKHFICGVECGSCHKEISSTYHYCPYCGRSVKPEVFDVKRWVKDL